MALTVARSRRRAAAWARELAAGTVGSLSVLAVPLTLGMLAFAPLGAAAAGVGVAAAFVAMVVGGIVYALAGRAAMPVAGPSSATSLILAGLVARLAADPALAAGTAAGTTAIVALCGATVMLGGALQMVLALLGLARLSRVVPLPVLAGFMNGVAVLIVLAQLPPLLGQPPGGASGLQAWAEVQPGAVVLGLTTAVLLWAAARRWPRAPVMLVALVAGTALHLLLSRALPQVGWGAGIGALAGTSAAPLALLEQWRDGAPALLAAHAPALAGTAIVLAVIGALESALNNLALDHQYHSRHEPRRELLAIAGTNFVCGALCSLPVVSLRARGVAILQSGGRGRGAVLGGSVALGLLYLIGGPLLAVLPLPVLAGTMLVIALTLVDRWSSRLLGRWWAGERSRELWLSLTVVALVCGVTVWRGFGAGVTLGVLLSMGVFMARMNRSLLRLRSTAAERPSRRLYPPDVEARLRDLRQRVVLFELEGALFFGSGERLLAEADTLAPDCRCLVVDLRHVGTIDETGAAALQRMGVRLQRRGVELMLAGVAGGSAQARALQSFGETGGGWPDVDRAVEAAERLLLGDAAIPPELPLAACSLLQGLDAAQCAAVAARLQVRELGAGEVLFAEGDAGDRLYLLTRGSVSVVSRPDAHGRTQRYLSMSPGMMFGETAMLDGLGRSAGAVADTAATVHALTQSDLDALMREQPELAAHLYRNIAIHLSQRLRSAAAAWHVSTR